MWASAFFFLVPTGITRQSKKDRRVSVLFWLAWWWTWWAVCFLLPIRVTDAASCTLGVVMEGRTGTRGSSSPRIGSIRLWRRVLTKEPSSATIVTDRLFLKHTLLILDSSSTRHSTAMYTMNTQIEIRRRLWRMIVHHRLAPMGYPSIHRITLYPRRRASPPSIPSSDQNCYICINKLWTSGPFDQIIFSRRFSFRSVREREKTSIADSEDVALENRKEKLQDDRPSGWPSSPETKDGQ